MLIDTLFNIERHIAAQIERARKRIECANLILFDRCYYGGRFADSYRLHRVIEQAEREIEILSRA